MARRGRIFAPYRPPSPAAPRRRAAGILSTAALCAAAAILAACTQGPMRVDERYYLGTNDGTNTNYFRITVKGDTELGKATFRQGWYDAYAVDALMGDSVGTDQGMQALASQTIQKKIDEGAIELNKQFVEALTKGDTKPETLKVLLERQQQLRLMPTRSMGKIAGTRTIEYNPSAGLATAREGKKLVMILSSDPNDVIAGIAAFAEEQKTQAAVQELSAVAAQAVRPAATAKFAAKQASSDVGGADDKLLAAQLVSSYNTIGKLDAATKKTDIAGEIAALAALVEQLQASRKDNKDN